MRNENASNVFEVWLAELFRYLVIAGVISNSLTSHPQLTVLFFP